MNDPKAKLHLSGVMMPGNKKHPETPTAEDVRLIIANSCVFKALEHIVAEKLHKIMKEKVGME